MEDTIGGYAPFVRTQSIAPPRPWAQACNIVYPRAILEQLHGFPEDMPVGEDTALAEAARAAGVPYVGAREVVMYHAVEDESALRHVLRAWRWRDLPLLVSRHPRLREDFPLWCFWKRDHPRLLAAVAGLVLSRRNRGWSALALPYLLNVMPTKYGAKPRSRLRAIQDVPGLVLTHVAEIASLAYGSIRHKTLFL